MFLCENVSTRLFVRVVVLYGLGLDFFQCACLPVRKWNCCIVQRDASCLPIILCQRLNLMCWVSLLKFHNRGLPAPLKLCPLVWAWEDEKAHLFTAHSKSDSLSLPYRVRREKFFSTLPRGRWVSAMLTAYKRITQQCWGVGHFMATLCRDRWAVCYCHSLEFKNPSCLLSKWDERGRDGGWSQCRVEK